MRSLLFRLAAVALSASCSRPPDVQRIAVVDVQRVVRSSKAGLNATRELGAAKEALQAALNEKQDQLKARLAAYEASPSRDPEEAQRLAALLTELRTEVDGQNKTLEAKQKAAVEALLPSVAATVKAIATREHIQYVLDRETVPFVADDAVDLTDRCIEALDRAPAP